MRSGLRLFLLLTFILMAASRPLQTDIQLSDVAVYYEYGGQINFQAQVNSPQPFDRAYLFIQSGSQPVQVFDIPVASQEGLLLSLDYTQVNLPPFSQNFYWYEFEFASDKVDSEKYSFFYEDNRTDWQSNQDDLFNAHWVKGDKAFGQSILNTARAAFENLTNSVGVIPPLPMNIYVYPSVQDLQSSLDLNHDWAAAHSSPEMGVIVLSITPGSEAGLELERQLSHEMAHMFLYQKTGEGYQLLPTWLQEGFASQAEIYPNPDYDRALQMAADSKSLLDFNTICNGFPMDASSAFLAYAQSTSFTQYILQTYGNSGFQDLLAQWSDGKSCQDGVQAGLGISLGELQNHWQQETLQVNTNSLLWEKLRPYALVGLLVLIPPVLAGVILSLRKS